MAWIIQCMTGLGELERMTQFKDKARKQEAVNAGLLAYPTLMVGDIVLYDANFVPVGDDQKQHLELTRNFVDRFNSRFGDNLLVKPEPLIPEEGGRIMSLQDPTSKMSKSDTNTKAFVSMLDTPKQITKKIKSAVTDSIGEVNYDKENQPAVANLLQIFASFSGKSIDSIVSDYSGQGYGNFKGDLADLVVSTIEPIQERYESLLTSSDLDDILQDGAKRASAIAESTLSRVEKAIGLTY